MLFSKRNKAESGLIFSTIIWGLTFPFMRMILTEISSVTVVFWRSFMAMCVFIPFIFLKKESRKQVFRLLPFGMVLGLFYYGAYLCQALGLQTINSGRSGFLTNLSVIFVPLFAPLFKREKPTKESLREDAISAIFAVAGMFLLTHPFSAGEIAVGDFWTILCALSFTFQIHFLQVFVQKYGQSTIFAFWQVAFMAIFSMIFLPFTHGNLFPESGIGIGVLLYLGVIAMVGTTWLQARFQYQTTAQRASVIFVLEPVFAGIFGYLLLKEMLSFEELIGGFLMIFAVVWIYFFRFGKSVVRSNFFRNRK